MDLTNRIGAWLTPDGCFFRVWTPNAVEVTVLLQDGRNWNVTVASARHALIEGVRFGKRFSRGPFRSSLR